MKKKNKFLVIGGSGFLGINLVKYLIDKNLVVYSLDLKNNSKYPDNKNFIFVQGNLLDKKKLTNILKKIDIVFHFGGIADIEYARLNPDKTIENNIIGTKNLLECISKSNVSRIIFGSTMYVYSNKGSFYKSSKQISEILIETYANEYKFEYTFLRYGSIYGPDSQDWNGLYKIIKEILNTKKIKYNGNGEEVRDYIHVIDAIKLTYETIKKEYSNKSVIISGNNSITSKNLLKLIFEILGLNKKFIKIQNKKINNYHYTYTPYNFTPNQAIKLVPKEYIDLGSGIIEVINQVNNS